MSVERFDQLFPGFHDRYVTDGVRLDCVEAILNGWSCAERCPALGFDSLGTALTGGYERILDLVVVTMEGPRFTLTEEE